MNKKYYSYWYMVPTFLVFLVLSLIPMFIGIGASFTNWHSANKTIEFIGLDNIKYLLTVDPKTKVAITNTLLYAGIVTVFQNIIGLALALVFNLKLKTNSFLRSAFFMPCIFSMLVISYSFSAILYPVTGPLDQFLTAIGMEWAIKYWLVDTSVNIFVLPMVHIWVYTGFCATIYLAGLKAIPVEVREASMIDGAGPWQRFRRITLPLVAPALTINLVSALIGTMKVFDLPYMLATVQYDNINILIYRSIGVGSRGYGSALAFVLDIIICAIAIPSLLILRKREVSL